MRPRCRRSSGSPDQALIAGCSRAQRHDPRGSEVRFLRGSVIAIWKGKTRSTRYVASG